MGHLYFVYSNLQKVIVDSEGTSTTPLKYEYDSTKVNLPYRGMRGDQFYRDFSLEKISKEISL